MRPMVRSRPVTTVAEWAVSGLTYREIAGRLHISVRTVVGHLDRTFEKIGVTSRAQPAAALTTGSGRGGRPDPIPAPGNPRDFPDLSPVGCPRAPGPRSGPCREATSVVRWIAR